MNWTWLAGRGGVYTFRGHFKSWPRRPDGWTDGGKRLELSTFVRLVEDTLNERPTFFCIHSNRERGLLIFRAGTMFGLAFLQTIPKPSIRTTGSEEKNNDRNLCFGSWLHCLMNRADGLQSQIVHSCLFLLKTTLERRQSKQTKVLFNELKAFRFLKT